MRKAIRTLTSSLLVLASTTSAVQANSLLEIYLQAKQNDPTILASEAGARASSERVNQSLANLLPQISANYSYSKSQSDSNGVFQVFDDPATPIDESQITDTMNSNDTTSQGYSLSLSQEIYNHGSWLGLKIAEKRALETQINFEAAKQDLIIRVAEAYFNVLAAKDNLAFAQAELKAVSQELEQTKQKFEVGLIAVTDVNEAQARYDQAVASEISAQNALDNYYELLLQITGRYYYDLRQLKDSFALRKPDPESIDAWVKQAQTNNLDIRAATIALDIAKRNIDISQAGHYPSVNLTASYSDGSRESDSSGTSTLGSIINNSSSFNDGDQQSQSISLNFNLPIYSGGRVNSQVKEAQALYQQAAHNLEAKRRAAISQTRSAYLGVVAAVSSVKAYRQAVISAQSALEATQAGFEVGTRTIVDVLQQTRQLYDSKRLYARAKYDYVLQTLRLKRAVGLLSEEDIKKVNQLLAL